MFREFFRDWSKKIMLFDLHNIAATFNFLGVMRDDDNNFIVHFPDNGEDGFF